MLYTTSFRLIWQLVMLQNAVGCHALMNNPPLVSLQKLRVSIIVKEYVISVRNKKTQSEQQLRVKSTVRCIYIYTLMYIHWNNKTTQHHQWQWSQACNRRVWLAFRFRQIRSHHPQIFTSGHVVFLGQSLKNASVIFMRLMVAIVIIIIVLFWVFYDGFCVWISIWNWIFPCISNRTVRWASKHTISVALDRRPIAGGGGRGGRGGRGGCGGRGGQVLGVHLRAV